MGKGPVAHAAIWEESFRLLHSDSEGAKKRHLPHPETSCAHFQWRREGGKKKNLILRACHEHLRRKRNHFLSEKGSVHPGGEKREKEKRRSSRTSRIKKEDTSSIEKRKKTRTRNVQQRRKKN